MRFIIYGAGGIGGPLGAFLHEAGYETILIARGAHLERVREAGLTVVTGEGARTVRVAAVAHPEEIDFRQDDVLALTMKAQDTEAALRDARNAGADPEAVRIFSVQNCIANERIALRYFANVYGVMIVIPGIHLEPGVVYNPIARNHGYMDVGRYPGGTDGVVEAWVEAVRKAGYAANPHADVMAPKGAKFLMNLANGIEAITDGRGDSGPYMQQARDEARRCLTAAGLPFEDSESFSARVKANRGTNVEIEGLKKRGSSWQSLQRGQGSIEADFLNGEIVLQGRLHGIPTPFNAVLQRVANRMALERQRPGLYSADELFEMAERLEAEDSRGC
jgi:2-dehydropantoate 2-reductase